MSNFKPDIFISNNTQLLIKNASVSAGIYVPFDGDWDLALDTVRDKLNKIAVDELTLSEIEKIYELEYKISQLQQKEFIGPHTEAAIYKMQDDLIKLLAKAINFIREEVFNRWIEIYAEQIRAMNPGIVQNIESVRNKLIPTGDVNKDIVTFNSALNTVHTTGPLVQYLEKWFGINTSSLDRLSRGTGYIERWNREIGPFLAKVANDPVKDTTNYKGIEIDIEWPKGSVRSYEGDDTYVTHMKCHYGYARGIDGNDGEELDIYLGDNDSDIAFIIEQVKEDGSYDEDKICLGFNDEEEAVDMYLCHMPAFMLGDIRAVPVDKLLNALYGEPEDRRGEEDLVPSEEKKEAKKKKKKNIHRKTKSDYVGPQSAQVGGIGGVGADKEGETNIKKATHGISISRNHDPI
jgi:hypothetical protein